MFINTNRRTKYEVQLCSADDPEWKWKIQKMIDLTWNKLIAWNPLLDDVIKVNSEDTWNVDYTIATIAVPLLKQLQVTKHGYGYIADKDVPKELRTGTKEHSEEKYEYFINEIIWCLGEIANEEHNAPDLPDDFELSFSDEPYSPKDKKIMARWSKDNDLYQKRICNGARLFGQYFRSLWH